MWQAERAASRRRAEADSRSEAQASWRGIAVKRARSAVAALLVLAACGGADPGEVLGGAPPPTGEGVEVATLRWPYRSFSVDIDVSVVTLGASDPERCETVAEIVIDKVTSFVEQHRAPDLSCEALRVDAAGDLILLASPTGIDWRPVPLMLSSDPEALHLGPVTVYDQDAVPTRYEFVLDGPPCEDRPECECIGLRRRIDEEEDRLDLGRKCD